MSEEAAVRIRTTVYDREQVAQMTNVTKLLARHFCTVEHPVFGRYQWLDDWRIYSDMLDQMLFDALTLLEQQMGDAGERAG
jgi:hypothetical protein